VGDGYSRFIALRQAHLVVEHMSEEDICDDVRDALLEDLRVEVHELYYNRSSQRERRAHSPVYPSSAAGGGPVVEGGYREDGEQGEAEGAAGEEVQDGAEEDREQQEGDGAEEEPADGEKGGEDRDFLDQQLPLADGEEEDGEQQEGDGADEAAADAEQGEGGAGNMAPLGALVVGGSDEPVMEEARVLSEGVGAAMEEVAADPNVAVGSKRVFSDSAQAFAKSEFEGRIARQKLDLEQRRADYVFTLVRRLADIQAMASLSDADRELASERIRGLIRDAY